ncbi:unnamed protein product [Blepharisma stoltei]|uniref:Uncharacterized protein n=1 Tax=Blepharisma stoltei TaxID=1481888 RepID=A0AAU9JL65_9CILI|nr:unnamed protein product [Blepharisma stoltei]
MDDLQEIIAELSSNTVKADTLLEEIVSQAWRKIYSAYLFWPFCLYPHLCQNSAWILSPRNLLEEEHLALFEELFNSMP